MAWHGGVQPTDSNQEKKVREVLRRSKVISCTDVGNGSGSVTTGVVRSLRAAGRSRKGLVGTGFVSHSADVRCACLDANTFRWGEARTRDRQLQLINWSEPRHCVMQEGSAIRPWAGPSSGRTICSSRPPRNEAPCRLSLLASHFSPCFKGRFLARRSTPRKCESRETCLIANATCAQNAILAVHLLPSRLIVVVSRVQAASCHQHHGERRGMAPES